MPKKMQETFNLMLWINNNSFQQRRRIWSPLQFNSIQPSTRRHGMFSSGSLSERLAHRISFLTLFEIKSWSYKNVFGFRTWQQASWLRPSASIFFISAVYLIPTLAAMISVRFGIGIGGGMAINRLNLNNL